MSVGNEGMSKLITVVNRLQDAFATSGLPFGLELPQIAVVGGQSAGKSSVLENFVGKDFLPRGSGIVTRRPLILQLHTCSEEYAEFLHVQGRKFTNFAEVRQEIEAETDRETGTNKGISSRPINLRVYSPNVLNLTLVDLPGMTRVAVGDQPPDIEVQIRNMVLEFIKKENCLILAVSPANSDLANSDAMKIAKEVDPSGNRTIGVITKLDLMDEGTDAREILLNNLIPLKRGYIGVVNRSQKDIDGRKDIRAAMEAEKSFFANHSSYKDMTDRMGTPYLQRVLNKELGRHIQETLPQIRNSLRSKMLEVKKELGTLQDTSSPGGMRNALMKQVQDFADEVETEIQGLTSEINTNRLAGGAKINRMFYNEFATVLAIEKIPTNVLRREIAFAIKNIHGVRNGIFTPDMAFHATVVKIIKEFQDPVQQCVTMSAEVLGDIITKAAAKVITCVNLREEAEFLLTAHIQERTEIAQKQLATHVEAETAFMNTRHEDFIGKPGEASYNDQESPEFTQSLDNVKRKLETTNKVIQRGFLHLQSKKSRLGGSQLYWFTLTSSTLTWYTDQQEKDDVFALQLTPKIKIKADDKNKKKFSLYKADQKPIMPDHKTLDFICGEEADFEKWIASFKSSGIYSEFAEENGAEGKQKRDASFYVEKPEVSEKPKVGFAPTDGTEISQRVEDVKRRVKLGGISRHRETIRDYTKSMKNPGMERQTETIKTMVESYLKIVGKTIRDLVPKYIMFFLVLNTQKYITSELLSRIMMENDVATLMKEDNGAAEKREQLQKVYTSAEEALKIINEASSIGA